MILNCNCVGWIFFKKQWDKKELTNKPKRAYSNGERNKNHGKVNFGACVNVIFSEAEIPICNASAFITHRTKRGRAREKKMVLDQRNHENDDETSNRYTLCLH